MLPTKATGTTLGTALRLTAFWFLAHGAAPESNRPSVGLPRLTDFEDRSALAWLRRLTRLRNRTRNSWIVLPAARLPQGVRLAPCPDVQALPSS